MPEDDLDNEPQRKSGNSSSSPRRRESNSPRRGSDVDMGELIASMQEHKNKLANPLKDELHEKMMDVLTSRGGNGERKSATSILSSSGFDKKTQKQIGGELDKLKAGLKLHGHDDKAGNISSMVSSLTVEAWKNKQSELGPPKQSRFKSAIGNLLSKAKTSLTSRKKPGGGGGGGSSGDIEMQTIKPPSAGVKK